MILQASGFDLAMIYFLNVDTLGHTESADGEVLREEVDSVDKMLGEFLQSLEDLGIREETDVVIVSDHGMTNQVKTFLKEIFDVCTGKNYSEHVAVTQLNIK